MSSPFDAFPDLNASMIRGITKPTLPAKLMNAAGFMPKAKNTTAQMNAAAGIKENTTAVNL